MEDLQFRTVQPMMLDFESDGEQEVKIDKIKPESSLEAVGPETGISQIRSDLVIIIVRTNHASFIDFLRVYKMFDDLSVCANI